MTVFVAVIVVLLGLFLWAALISWVATKVYATRRERYARRFPDTSGWPESASEEERAAAQADSSAELPEAEEQLRRVVFRDTE